MGEIFRATDSSLGRAVAIKILSERYAEDDDVRGRFTRESLAAARLSSYPNIVTIYDVGEYEDRPYIVMEYMSGGSLEDRLRNGRPAAPAQALQWLEDAGRALDHAHAEGVVHRDVKPGNLLLGRDADVHVADFGIASAAGLDSLTMTGTVMGTAGYLAPEQAQGERATPASDRYGLAVVGFELLTGTRPYEADSITAEATAHVQAPVPSAAARNPNLPPEIDGVFRRALAKAPGERYPTCAEYVAALRDAMHSAAGRTRIAAAPPVPPPGRRTAVAPRRPLWPILLGGLALAAVAGLLLATVLSSGGNEAKTRTIVKEKTLPGTTVRQTVTQAPTTQPQAPAPSADGHTLNDRGYSLMQQGDFGNALPLLQQSVQKLQGAGPADPYEGYANYNLGYTLLQLGSCDEATTYLENADRLEPHNKDVRQAMKRAERCRQD
jgi:serine/threonine-protein kinase